MLSPQDPGAYQGHPPNKVDKTYAWEQARFIKLGQ